MIFSTFSNNRIPGGLLRTYLMMLSCVPRHISYMNGQCERAKCGGRIETTYPGPHEAPSRARELPVPVREPVGPIQALSVPICFVAR